MSRSDAWSAPARGRRPDHRHGTRSVRPFVLWACAANARTSCRHARLTPAPYPSAGSSVPTAAGSPTQRVPRSRLGDASRGPWPARPAHPRPSAHARDDPVRCRRRRSDVLATLGHSSLQVTERYSRAREGIALRAGAALKDALKSTGVEPSHRIKERVPADRNGTLMAQPHRGSDGMGR